MYYIIEEATEAVYGYTPDLDEAIYDAKNRLGKFLVVDQNNKILYDTEPNVSYKI